MYVCMYVCTYNMYVYIVHVHVLYILYKNEIHLQNLLPPFLNKKFHSTHSTLTHFTQLTHSLNSLTQPHNNLIPPSSKKIYIYIFYFIFYIFSYTYL